ncbi:MAG TPA: DUF6351 family protein, partial [Armatimonadota bacterium]
MRKSHPRTSIAWRCGLLLLLLAAALGAWSKDPALKNIRVEQGMLGASKIMIAVPKKWNRSVLIIAHGLVMENMPLSADFSLEDACLQPLLQEGWMIASTSYRRNGYLHDEAIEDIDQLRQHIITTYGAPERVYLEGGSMGGAIVTKMAETHQGQYDGVLAVGAVLVINSLNYSFVPQMPLLFISNQNEMTDPKAYLAKGANANAPLQPAVWQVKRDGHCNLNAKEELAALRALFAWRETQQIERDKDATIVLSPKSVARFHDGGVYAGITEVSASYGNIDTQFTADNLKQLGITLGKRFTATCNGKTVTVLYGTSYFDVPRGEWVAFIIADGYLKIARHYENAAAVFGCKAHDQI